MDQPTDPQTVDRSTVERILRAAFKAGASDVHFKAGEKVLLRVRGKLQSLNAPALKPDDTQRLLRSLLPARLEGEDSEKLRELDFSFAMAGVGRFRVNAFRQRGSVAIVVRVIPLDIPRLSDLNLPPVMPDLAAEQRGLILVTGTTGSGKSTTLAGMISEINHSRTAHVITIEDPIEFFFRNKRASIVQREIGTDTDSFPGALRAALRQDPDVVMIGEMRDTETIDIALKAAETGHLVLSTAHTTDASKTIQRMLSVFPMAEQAMVRMRLSESLRAVVSQRLLPRANGSGLIPAVEVMVATRYVQDSIRNAEKTQLLNEYIAEGKNYGMQTFDQCLLRMLREGIITKGVALSAATSPSDLDLQIRMGTDVDDEMEVDHHMWDEAAHQNDLKQQGEIEEEAVDAQPDSLFDDEKPEAESGVGSYGLSRNEIPS
jgi:twitching motility protein PilT